ncbi:uncharacterized protein LY89DRAFT_700991 [Mollisia scopiformis]|uniref:Uncharacterized protein n=1 Tax=Mollisia scopiformis TaxID=149040 RepID=A0A132BC15_MOLSC|nr:uncharacterized protein LY89DRAFT_700991 [Mollisia scopiformis]KUJ09936.1 hypothetical protein LY89DRAFT_700991 [Mollisia scopiformis]
MDTSTLTAVALGIAFQIYVSPIPEVSSIKVLVTYSCCNLLLAVYLLTSGLVSDTIVRVTTLNITFLTTACLLTLVRRAFFSPLANFPGPPHYALTNLFKANLYRMGKNAYTILDHHIKYDSDVIRIGPNELSIRNVEAIERLYKGKYPRGTFYGAARVDGATNLNTEGDYELQTPWRRIW